MARRPNQRTAGALVQTEQVTNCPRISLDNIRDYEIFKSSHHWRVSNKQRCSSYLSCQRHGREGVDQFTDAKMVLFTKELLGEFIKNNQISKGNMLSSADVRIYKIRLNINNSRCQFPIHRSRWNKKSWAGRQRGSSRKRTTDCLRTHRLQPLRRPKKWKQEAPNNSNVNYSITITTIWEATQNIPIWWRKPVCSNWEY